MTRTAGCCWCSRPSHDRSTPEPGDPGDRRRAAGARPPGDHPGIAAVEANAPRPGPEGRDRARLPGPAHPAGGRRRHQHDPQEDRRAGRLGAGDPARRRQRDLDRPAGGPERRPRRAAGWHDRAAPVLRLGAQPLPGRQRQGHPPRRPGAGQSAAGHPVLQPGGAAAVHGRPDRLQAEAHRDSQRPPAGRTVEGDRAALPRQPGAHPPVLRPPQRHRR